jgi:hypothetical protein
MKKMKRWKDEKMKSVKEEIKIKMKKKVEARSWKLEKKKSISEVK